MAQRRIPQNPGNEPVDFEALLPSTEEVSPEGSPDRPLGRRRFIVREAGPNARQIEVTTDGPPPTPEEQTKLLQTVYGEGAVTKQQLPGAGAAAGSILGTEAIKRAYATRAAPGLVHMGLGAAAKKVPIIAGITGTMGAVGEGARQWQIPSEIDRFRVTNVGDTAMLGQMDVDWDPTSPLSRAKMIGLRGLEEAGLDVVGGAAMKGVGKIGELLYRVGFHAPKGVVPPLMQRTRGRALQDTLRIGEESKRELLSPSTPSTTGWGWTPRGPGRFPNTVPRTDPTSGWAFDMERELPPRSGLAQTGRIGPQFSKSGWGQLGNLPQAMSESGRAARRIVEPLRNTPVQGMDFASLQHDIFSASAPKGSRLDEWLRVNDDFNVATNPTAFQELDDGLGKIFQRYVANPEQLTDEMLLVDEVPTIGRLMDDVSYLEGKLDSLYDLRQQGKYAQATPAILIAKSIRDALSNRIDRTIAAADPALHGAWKRQRELSQQFGVALDLVKGSPDTMLSGVAMGAVGVGAAGGVVAGSGPTGIAMAAPIAVLGSPPISAKLGQSLWNRRLSTLPQTGVRIGRGLTGPSMTEGRSIESPTVAGVVDASGGRMQLTGNPTLPVQPVGTEGEPLTLDQARLLRQLLP